VIVRILGEGQLEVADSALDELNELDAQLEAAVERSDEAGFAAALAALLGRVREIGAPADPVPPGPDRDQRWNTTPRGDEESALRS
jgi:hypothetical protein